MIDGSEQTKCARPKGRPVAQNPRSERVSIKLTKTEYKKFLRNAGNIPFATYGRNKLLQAEESSLENRQRITEAWRTLDLMSEHLFRIDDALQGGYRPEEDELLPLLGNVLDTLDQVRILLAGKGPLL